MWSHLRAELIGWPLFAGLIWLVLAGAESALNTSFQSPAVQLRNIAPAAGVFVPPEVRESTSQLEAVKLNWVRPEGYRPPVPAAYSRATSGGVACCTLPATAANAGKPSTCQGEYQESRWPSSVLPALLGERQTLAISVRSSHAVLPKGHGVEAVRRHYRPSEGGKSQRIIHRLNP
jgi:hypothetical protein